MTKKVRVPFYVFSSFADGTRPCFFEKRVEEHDVLAEALWLENHGRAEDAERVLDEYCLR